MPPVQRPATAAPGGAWRRPREPRRRRPRTARAGPSTPPPLSRRPARPQRRHSYAQVGTQGGQLGGADPRHLEEVVDGAVAAVLAPVLDDGGSEGRTDARQ